MNEQITIPDELYVGYTTHGNYDAETDTCIPYRLGFIVPNGTDTAAKKRIATVNNWADDSEKPEIHANELLEGYSIPQFIYRTYWGGSNVVWRIKDPRNFEFEISCANLAKILECTTIVNGVIQGKCIIGRSGAKNILLPEKSEPYQNALVSTFIKKMDNISKKDINVGDILLLSDESVVVYYGQYYGVILNKERYNGYYGRVSKEESANKRDLIISKSKYFLVGNLYTKENIGKPLEDQYISICTDIKVVGKLGVQPNSEQLITQYISDKNSIRHNLSNRTLITVIKEKQPIKFSLEKCEDNDAIKKGISLKAIKFIVGKFNGMFYSMYSDYYGNNNHITGYNFELVDDTHGIYYHGFNLDTGIKKPGRHNTETPTIDWASDPQTKIDYYDFYVIVGDKKFSGKNLFNY